MRAAKSDAVTAAEVAGQAPPTCWPRLTAADAEAEWPVLRSWVEGLQARFPHTLRLPTCWWRHNDLVELLSALHDHERGAYGPHATPGTAIEWHRAFRETEARLETWVKRLPCAAPGRDHPEGTSTQAWTAFVAADTAGRPETAPPPD